MTRTKKVSLGIHEFLLVERRSPTDDESKEYYVHLAGRGGLDVSHTDLSTLLVEMNKFKNGGKPYADEL